MSLTRADITQIFNDTSLDFSTRVRAGDALRYDLMRNGEVTDGLRVAREVIELCLTQTEYNKDTYDALERAYITCAPHDFHCYMTALEWNRARKDRFYYPRRKIMKPLADVLTDMIVNDLYDIVMISSPPRVGKSSVGLFFLSWLIGRNPEDPILATGYAEKITKMFYEGLIEIYENSEYNYQAIFPMIDLVGQSAKDLTLDFRNDGKKQVRKYKTVTARPIDGSLTGATEARQLLYCDDLVRDIEEALNPNRLMGLRDKLVTNVYSRKKDGCKELHIGTRWSVHDPIGWVERMNEDNPRCKVIRIPALDEETDESNFVYDYNVGFSTDYYKTLRTQEDDVTWQCVYQQQPVEREGLLFPKSDLTYIYEIPDITKVQPDDIFTFCDVAFGGEDYLAMPIAYQYGDTVSIVNAVFIKGGYDITEPIVAGMLMNHGVQRVIFESNNGGDFYAKDISDILKDAKYKLMLTAQRTASNKSKETRIIAHSPTIKKFNFLHPSVASDMYVAFLNNLTSFTVSGKNLHDDAPDSLAGLAAMMRTNLNATISVFDRKYI